MPAKDKISAFVRIFTGYNPADQDDYSTGYQVGGGSAVGYTPTAAAIGSRSGESLDGLGTVTGEFVAEPELPLDRFSRYVEYERMARDPTLAEGLSIHLTHALSVNKRTGLSFEIVPAGDDLAVAKELMDDIGFKLNKLMVGWARTMCVYGVSYIRPHIADGAGITHFESNYYTLPRFVREYERAGALAGFTCEHFIEPGGIRFRLSQPWDLIPLKIPYWAPDSMQMPIQQGSEPFSLLTDPKERVPQETQNYGTSLFENTFGPYSEFKQAMRSLKGARQISGNIERLIGLNTDSLDPVRAASYVNTIAATLKRSAESSMKALQRRGILPTVFNRLLPIMGGGKGGMTVDTQVYNADIQHIEDVMMHMRRMASSIGLDISMLGWSDMLAGGLGEGGFFRTSLQAAMRAQWIRMAVQTFIERAIEIHMAVKHGKVFTDAYRPYKVVFNSLNNAIQEEENVERASRAEYSSMVVTILDTIQNGSLAHSETFKRLILGNVLDVDEKQIDSVIKELASAVTEQGEDAAMFESLMRNQISRDELEQIIRDTLLPAR
ncbi:hypothetical protein [Edwardsiella tarda]|uniref:hypothetical protein n=1 Tax=Edwardsiella tarda TaxID=636 RepID=UPI0003064F6E|nr:hypothetical protein [Edwardsiella tarda]